MNRSQAREVDGLAVRRYFDWTHRHDGTGYVERSRYGRAIHWTRFLLELAGFIGVIAIWLLLVGVMSQ